MRWLLRSGLTEDEQEHKDGNENDPRLCPAPGFPLAHAGPGR